MSYTLTQSQIEVQNEQITYLHYIKNEKIVNLRTLDRNYLTPNGVRSKIFKFLALLFVGCYICIHFLLQLGPGGGFGPVSDTGYGISYMIAGNKKIFFHISSKRSAQITDSTRFMDLLFETLCDMKSLFE